ncbi:MAG TPA: hypothetical protein PKM59_14755 [Thermodesulfobacteriota bacterium]|nr:hypothetical protein [Thermodesulfobacteriota bacterium]
MSLVSTEHIVQYYNTPGVRSCMASFLGGSSLEEATCVYVSCCDSHPYYPLRKLPNQLAYYLDHGLDVGRSLWDRRFLPVHLDIEYVNFDFPAEPYLDMERMFEVQNPVVLAVRETLYRFGIFPFHLLTGRGHHFVWMVRADSRTYRSLIRLGHIPAHLKDRYRDPHPPSNEPVSPDLGTAFSGLAMVMEYLAFCIQDTARCSIPVEITEVIVGPVERGREIVSIDISEYGDPLDTRMIRIPFSIYRKSCKAELAGSIDIAERIPLLVAVPAGNDGFRGIIPVMQNLDEAACLATRTSTEIPDRTAATMNLVDEYMGSELKCFHDWFYSEEQNKPEEWTTTYDRTPLDILPPCSRRILEQPNDILLKPAALQLLVRTMLSLGWHPRHIAGLIRSKYERDFGWGFMWYTYDAATRADFYTRIFSGPVVTERDSLIDFNCCSTREKGLCFHHESCQDLRVYRDALVRRRTYGRLGCGPFNRLLL